jgi:hypothetical protein
MESTSSGETGFIFHSAIDVNVILWLSTTTYFTSQISTWLQPYFNRWHSVSWSRSFLLWKPKFLLVVTDIPRFHTALNQFNLIHFNINLLSHLCLPNCIVFQDFPTKPAHAPFLSNTCFNSRSYNRACCTIITVTKFIWQVHAVKEVNIPTHLNPVTIFILTMTSGARKLL